MSQRIFLLIALFIAAYFMLLVTPLPVNIYQIEKISETDLRFIGSTNENSEQTSIYSKLNLVPENFNNNCYSQFNTLTSNGLADKLGNLIGWQHNVQWNNDCDPEGQIENIFGDAYSILISKNPMVLYPEFSNLEQRLVTETGIEVDLSTYEYPYTNKGKTIVFAELKYSFKVVEEYVFVTHTVLRDTWDDETLLKWIDSLNYEIKSVLE